MNNRTCSICKIEKTLDNTNFYRSKSQKAGFHPECKECSRVKDKRTNAIYYLENVERKKQKVKDRRTAIVMFVEEWKKQRECVRCGINDHKVLEFHHRDPKSKDLSIGKAAKHGWGMGRLLTEMAKCDLLCANCHRVVDASYSRKTTQVRFQAVSKYIHLYKTANPCRCGISDPLVLEFHHRDPATKSFNISDLRYTMEAVAVEIQKCEVICANCHRRQHYDNIRPEFRRSIGSDPL